ncbi:hypothetical protein J6590_035355 [Homalodisca vitripennis]|nr:hypothetical protein J6590_035355 [Homalodisca vitripennis]
MVGGGGGNGGDFPDMSTSWVRGLVIHQTHNVGEKKFGVPLKPALMSKEIPIGTFPSSGHVLKLLQDKKNSETEVHYYKRHTPSRHCTAIDCLTLTKHWVEGGGLTIRHFLIFIKKHVIQTLTGSLLPKAQCSGYNGYRKITRSSNVERGCCLDGRPLSDPVHAGSSPAT